MDYNRGEAVGALDLAEKKFKDQAYRGAMKKAQKLFPSLQNLSQTIAAYEVYSAAAIKKLTSGQTDWHAVLRVDPSADYNAIKQQFKNMCLLTHPDKNRRSSAADGAFKIVMKAWSFLSTAGSFSSNRSRGSTSSSSTKSPEETNWQYLVAKIRCANCGLLRHWDFSPEPSDRDKSLYHYCNSFSTWCLIRNGAATAEVLLACEGCSANLGWGSCRPFGYQCRGWVAVATTLLELIQIGSLNLS